VSEPPLVEIEGVVKAYGGDRPLKIGRLRVAERDRLVIGGFDAHAAEMFTHLVCGALLPDEGTIRVAGVATSDIKTDREWLVSLDRFGLVSNRAVLIEGLSTLANLVLPLTLSIDPMPAPARAEAEAVARHVALDAERLSKPVSELSAVERLRLHLGRALMQRPRLILLEHPTATLTRDDERAMFGRLIAAVADARQVGWIAVSDDDVFAKATGGGRMQVRPGGELTEERGWWPWRRGRRS
jgi:ABC-type lipoprotein export system ATPase subunit